MKLLGDPGEGLSIGAEQMALSPLCRGAQEREVQWDQGSFCGVRLNVLQRREHWQKLGLGKTSTFAPCHLINNGSK